MRSLPSPRPTIAPPTPSFPQSAPARSHTAGRQSRRAQAIHASRRPLAVAGAHRRHGRNKSCAHRWETRAGAESRRRRAARSRCFPRPLALLDQLPKLAVLAELVVFRHREFASEKKITKRVLVQDAVDCDALRPPLEIDPVIL